MSTDRPKRESMSLEEATISNMWEIAAIVEVLERKGLCTITLRRMLKKSNLLTRPALALISPSRPESDKAASSPRHAPCPSKAGASEEVYVPHFVRAVFSILLRQRLPMLFDQRWLMLHGWLERSGWIYCIRKGAGSSVLAFEFF